MLLMWPALAATSDLPGPQARREADTAQAVLMTNPRNALSGAEVSRSTALKIADANARAIATARADWLIGAALIGLNRPAEAITAINRSLDCPVRRLTPRSKLVGDLLFARATALMLLGKIEPALAGLRSAFDVYRDAGETRGQALALQNIGVIHVLARDYQHALAYFAQSLDLSGVDQMLLLSNLNNRAGALKELNQSDAAIVQYERALAVARRLKSPLLELRVLSSLADAQFRSGRYEAAANTARRGLGLSRSSPAGDWRSDLFRVAAQIAMRDGQLDVARQLIEQSLGGGASSASPLIRDSHRIAYEVYKARGESRRALDHLEQYKRLDDQARTIAASANAALMAAQFDFANQRFTIAQLKTGESVRDATIARGQRAILIILLAGSGLVTILLLLGYLSLRRSRNEVRDANEELSEANVELAAALAARTQFLATTSHEIRTPLNGILGMTQVILADRGLDAAFRSKIELVHGAGETMRALVDDILDVAKITNGELTLHPAEMDLARLLRDAAHVWDGQAQAKGIAIAVDLGECPERIVQDEVRLRQIVFNLMANAVKFTDRGEVRLSARVHRTAGAGAEHLLIAVRDTGIGIPPDKLGDIFESFRQVDGGTTRRHGGTGLGLAICRSLARAMGGEVTVDSVLGAGATFSLDLPLVRAAARPAPAGARADATLATARLLLIEANPLSQSILRAVLGPKVDGMAVAANGDEAALALAREPADLLVIDGPTLGGVAAAGGLARPVLDAGGRAVLLWPLPDEALREQAAALHLTAVISTPIAAPDLVAALAALYVPERTAEEIAA